MLPVFDDKSGNTFYTSKQHQFKDIIQQHAESLPRSAEYLLFPQSPYEGEGAIGRKPIKRFALKVNTSCQWAKKRHNAIWKFPWSGTALTQYGDNLQSQPVYFTFKARFP